MTFSRDNVRIYDFSLIPDVILDTCTFINYEKDSIIVTEDTPLAGSYYVLSGRVCGYTENADGDKTIMAIIESGGSFGEGDIFLGYVNVSATFAAETACQLVLVERSKLLELMDNHKVALYMARSLSKKFLSTARMYVDSVDESAISRVCGAFLDLDSCYGAEIDDIRIIDTNVTQQYLADYLGISRITINKCVGKLRKLKLIHTLDYGYWIPDRDSIVKYMKFIE
ncbi:MAG: Crp/Fnr family transcriptional regulator [Actinobacteria bacterium]|nr:Crp/Fnr family transcriptional regulator [Actinomycetota bacterium]